jgi:anti-anti-sigma factor
MEMHISELPAGVTCVALNGRLDAPGADAIGLRFTAAAAAEARPVVVDLSGVSFIASMGIRLLISAARALHLKGGKMALYGAQPLVQGVLDDAALDQIIPVEPTQADALAALAG